MFADSGATTLDLQRHGGWKSAAVAQTYVDESSKYKKEAAKKITNAILGSTRETSQKRKREYCLQKTEN